MAVLFFCVCFFFLSLFLGNGFQTGSELSGLSTAYNNASSYAGTGRASGRVPAPPSVPVRSNNARPSQSTISNGRDPRRASKR